MLNSKLLHIVFVIIMFIIFAVVMLMTKWLEQKMKDQPTHAVIRKSFDPH